MKWLDSDPGRFFAPGTSQKQAETPKTNEALAFSEFAFESFLVLASSYCEHATDC
jgi:hypothetical protein